MAEHFWNCSLDAGWKFGDFFICKFGKLESARLGENVTCENILAFTK
jgi:hypothetical protein